MEKDMSVTSEWTKYQFHQEDAGNGVTIKYCGELVDFSDEFLCRRDELKGHSAGTLVTVLHTNKEWDEVYAHRVYRLMVSKTIPGARNEWGEMSQAKNVAIIEPWSEWILAKWCGKVDLVAPKDAPRVLETNEEEMKIGPRQKGDRVIDGKVVRAEAAA